MQICVTSVTFELTIPNALTDSKEFGRVKAFGEPFVCVSVRELSYHFQETRN